MISNSELGEAAPTEYQDRREGFLLRSRARLLGPLALLALSALGVAALTRVVTENPIAARWALGSTFTLGATLLWMRRRQPLFVRCSGDALEIPGFLHARRIPLRRIHAIYRRGRSLVVTQKGLGRKLSLARRHFVEATAVERLELALLERLVAVGADTQTLARRRAIASTGRVIPYFTGTLSLGLMLIFAMELATGATRDLRTLIEEGAVVPSLVVQGEWWRVLSGTLLHRAWDHLGANIGGLLFYAVLLEGRLGRWRIAAICLASWIGSGVLAASAPLAIAVGASGIPSGLAGAWLGQLRRMHDLPHSPTWLWILAAAIVLQVAADFWLPGVSFRGHLGGALAGLVLSLWYVPRIDRANPVPSQSRSLRIAVSIGASLLLLIAAYGFTRPRRLDPAAELRREVQQGYTPQHPEQPQRVNQWAWLLAIDSEAEDADLEQARGLLEQAAAIDALEPNSLDTLAALRFRCGNPEGALAAQLEAIDRPQAVSLLLHKIREADGMLERLGVYLAASPRRPELEDVALRRDTDGSIVLDPLEQVGEPRVAYLLAYRNRTLVGVVASRFPGEWRRLRISLSQVPPDADLQLAYLAPCNVAGTESRYVSLTPDAVSFLTPDR